MRLTRADHPATGHGRSGKEASLMEMYMTTGARCFPQFGPLAVPGGVWTKRVPTAPSGAHRLRTVHPNGSDLQVTDRTRMSASEP